MQHIACFYAGLGSLSTIKSILAANLPENLSRGVPLFTSHPV